MHLARANIIQFMKEYKSTCSRQVGNHMKLVKFHMLLHIIDDIERLGSPQNTNGAPCESNFKPQKKESVRTQRRAKLFHEQMAFRIHEQMVISRATQEKKISKNIEEDRLISGSKFRIQYNCVTMNYELNWRRETHKRQIYKRTVLEFVYNIFFNSENQNKVDCFTEHRINGEIFHGDCSYRGEQEWYDWANILWDNSGHGSDTRPILGKIHMFVDCTKYEFSPHKHINGLDITGNEIYTIVSSLTWREPSLVGVSKIFYKGQIDTHDGDISLYVIPISAINSTAFAFHDVEKHNLDTMDNDCIIMTPTEDWGGKFYSLYQNEN